MLRRVDTALPRGFGSRPASRFSPARALRVAVPLAIAAAAATVLALALPVSGPGRPGSEAPAPAAAAPPAPVAPTAPALAAVAPGPLAAAHVELMFGAPTAPAALVSRSAWPAAPGDRFSRPAGETTAPSAPPASSRPAAEPEPLTTAALAPAPLAPAPLAGPASARPAPERPLLTPPPAVLAARPVTAVPRRAAARAEAAASATPVPADTRGFLQRLFGGGAAPATTALAYAPADGGDPGGVRGLRTSPADEPVRRLVGEKTAIYDISARAVIMPDGRRLEAHSGLGEHMDDIRSHRVKNRGVTPPNVYTLRMRERPFHGVRAIRLIPVDEGRMFGRDGILAHSYLLGPRGDSNGCVSFKDYDAFLAAFLRGEVNRMVVVESATSPRAFAAAGLSAPGL